MTLFSNVKRRYSAKRLTKALRKNFTGKLVEKTGVVVGPKLVSVDGQLFESTITAGIGSTVSVVNIGSPAAVLYGPATGSGGSTSSGGTSTSTITDSGALAALSAHLSQGYVEAHSTSPGSRVYHSVKYGVVGGGIGIGVDESTNLRTMFNTVGENGGGTCVISSADGISPIIIDQLVSVYHSNMTLDFRSPILLGAAGGIRVMGEMVEYVVGATFAGGLATGSPASEGDTTVTLSATAAKMQADDYVDGMLITFRGENDETGAALTKQQVVITSRNTGANTITFAQELEYDFDPTYPGSAYGPTDATTIFPNLTWALTADIVRGDMTATVADTTGMVPGNTYRLYDTRVEVDLNAAAIRGSGLPYENECRLEYITITAIDAGTGVVTFDRPASKGFLQGSPYFGGIAAVTPVQNVHIRGIVATYHEAQTSKNAHAISLNFAKDCTIENCKIDGSGGGMGQQFRISDSLNCWVINCIGEFPAYHESGQGYIFTNYKSDRSGHRNCLARGGRHNYLMQACTNWTVDSCQSFDAWISGIDAHGVDEYDGLLINCQCSQMNNHPSDASNGACVRIGNTSHYVGTHWTRIINCTCYGNYETNIAAVDFLAASSHLEVDGCTVWGGYYGIKNSKNPSQCTPPTPITDVKIVNCTFHNITNRAIYLEGVPDTAGGTRSSSNMAGMLIENCTTWNCAQHIHVSGGDAITSLTISECQAIMPITSPGNDYYGIALTDVSGLMIRNNNFHLCSRGISLTDATNACIIGNTLTATIDATPITLAGTNTGPGGGALIYVANIVDNASVGGTASPDFTSDVSITGTDPQLVFVESDAAANNQRWDIAVNGEQFLVRAVNDANSSASNAILIDRTANTIDSIALAATAIGLTGSTTITGDAIVTGAIPRLVLIETGVTANNTRWDVAVNAEVLYFRAVNDADSTAGNWMTVNRTANVIDSVEIAATSILLTGALTLTGAISLAGAVTLTSSLGVESVSPSLYWKETDGGTDAKIWDINVDSGVLSLRAVNDAYSSATVLLTATRAGNIETTGTLSATGQVTTKGSAGAINIHNRATNVLSAGVYSPTAGHIALYNYNTSTTPFEINNSGVIFGNYDSDIAAYFGRTALGGTGYGDFASLSHLDSNTATGYGVLHYNTGALFLNSASGQVTRHRINNSDVMVVSSTGVAVTGDLAVTGNLGAWTGVTYNGTWANIGGSDSAGRYRKFGDIVYVEGICERPSGTSTLNIFDLPAGYRPATHKWFSTIIKYSGSQFVCRVEISTSGLVTITDPASGTLGTLQIVYVMLDGIQFSTT